MSDTPCKNCAFTKYAGITQVGCKAGRLAKFRETGAEVIEAYDEEKEFYVVRDRVCMYRRPPNWLSNKDIQKEVERARREIPFPYHAIVIGNDLTYEIVATIRSLQHQTILPIKITVIRPKGTTTNIENIRHCLQETDISWNLPNILNPEIDTVDKWVRLALMADKTPYFGVFHAGCIVPHSTFAVLAHKTIDELMQFALIKPNNKGSGWIMPINAWEYYRITGSKEKTLIENVEEDLKCQGIYQINELVPSFPE